MKFFDSFFNSKDNLINEIKTKTNPDINMISVENKANLENKRKVIKVMENLMCDNLNIKFFMGTSAKEWIKCRKYFFESAKILIE